MSLFSGLKPHFCRFAAVSLLMVASAGLPSAQTEPGKADYAILIVGDEKDPELGEREKSLIREMAKNLRSQQRLPIYSYHFNKERERNYCEKKLGVLREDLLFIGIVSLKDKVPQRVLFRIDRIVTPARAAQDIVNRAEELVADPQPPTQPSASPTASPSSAPQAAGKFRVQLGAFGDQKAAQGLVDQLRTKGYEAKFDKASSEGKEVFKVWVGSFQTKEDAQQASTELQADGFDKGFVFEK